MVRRLSSLNLGTISLTQRTDWRQRRVAGNAPDGEHRPGRNQAGPACVQAVMVDGRVVRRTGSHQNLTGKKMGRGIRARRPRDPVQRGWSCKTESEVSAQEPKQPANLGWLGR